MEEKVGKQTRQDILVAATLLHDIAKIDTLVLHPDGTADCPGHELIGAGRVSQFAERLGLNGQDELYVERIVRYHGLTSDILTLIEVKGYHEKYLRIFCETVGDVSLELALLMQADLIGSDLEAGDSVAYQTRMDILSQMERQLIMDISA